MKTQNEFKSSMEAAKQLPTHVDGELQEVYTFYEKSNNYRVIYDDSPSNIIRSIIFGRNKYTVSNGYIYTYGSNSTYFHKKYARLDIPVTGVEFKIVGLKRATSKLPAGVLIDMESVKFIY